MTDGNSGVYHVKYNKRMPTVWANVPGQSACFESGCFLSKKHPGFSPLRQKMLWLKKHKIPTESKTRQTRLATKLDIDREKHAML